MPVGDVDAALGKRFAKLADPHPIAGGPHAVLVVAHGRFRGWPRALDVSRYSAGDLAPGILEHAKDGARIGPRRAQEREAILLRLRKCELVRHHDALFGAVEATRAVVPARR